tara:strand:- start:258 stop:989 length:732 start_codon:yes stop_codon:yes gene_type:complete
MATTITGTTIDVGPNKLVANSAGNVGIGTASPTANLSVNSSNVETKINITDSTTGSTITDGLLLQSGAANAYLWNYEAGNLIVGNNNAEAMRIDAAGIVTMPLQPAFQVRPSVVQDNIATSGSVTVVLGSEIFDQNSDFNTSNSLFTAPVTGKYQFNFAIRLDNIDTAANYYQTRIVTSNRTYEMTQQLNRFSADVQYWNMPTMAALTDMDAGDTAFFEVSQSAGTAQTDIVDTTVVSGYLVC